MPRLGFNGFDAAAEGLARQAFEQLAPPGWALAGPDDSEFLLLDLDSMSGQMAWMKGLPEGITVIGVTASGRARTPFVLPADFSAERLGAVLAEASVSSLTRPPKEDVPAPAAMEPSTPAATALSPPAVAAPVLPTLAARLSRAAMPFAVQHQGLPRVVVDPQRQQFAPGRSLKALLAYATLDLPESAITPLDGDEAEAALRSAGDPQPLGRLAWLLALGGGEGRLLAHGPGTRFQLEKWPQVEREFPKHFRIATVMLKAPATVAEIAAASGASEAEVADYVNAAIAAGHASAS